MDNKALAQIVRDEVSKITSAMNKLGSKVNSLIEVVELREKNENSIAKQGNSNEHSHGSQLSVTSVSPSPANSDKPKSGANPRKPRRNLRRKAWRFFKRIFLKKDYLERAALLAGVIYATITVVQWHDLRKNFEADERAWIVPRVDDIQQFQDSIPVTVTNSGKSAVLTSRMLTWLEILPYDTPPSLESNPKTAWYSDLSLILPEQHYPTFTVRMSADGQSRKPASGDETEALKNGLDYIAVYGVIVYSDQFGWHWTKFCQWSSFSNSIPVVNGKPITYNAHGCIYYRAVGDGKISIFPDFNK